VKTVIRRFMGFQEAAIEAPNQAARARKPGGVRPRQAEKAVFRPPPPFRLSPHIKHGKAPC
jgi:hypothetical protein